MHEDLRRTKPHDQANGPEARQLHIAHHQREGDDGEKNRQTKAGHQAAHRAMAPVVAVTTVVAMTAAVLRLRLCAHQTNLTR